MRFHPAITLAALFLTSFSGCTKPPPQPPASNLPFNQRITAENNYSNKKLSSLSSTQKEIEKFLRTKDINKKSSTSPIKFGSFEFETKKIPGRYHPVLFRREYGADNPWSEAFDIQALFPKTAVYGLHGLKINAVGEELLAVVSTEKHGSRSLYHYSIRTNKLNFIHSDVHQPSFGSNSEIYFIAYVNGTPRKLLSYSFDKSELILTAKPNEKVSFAEAESLSSALLLVDSLSSRKLFNLENGKLKLLAANIETLSQKPAAVIGEDLFLAQETSGVSYISKISRFRSAQPAKGIVSNKYRNGVIQGLSIRNSDLLFIFRSGSNYSLNILTPDKEQKNPLNTKLAKINKVRPGSKDSLEVKLSDFSNQAVVEISANSKTKTVDPPSNTSNLSCKYGSRNEVPLTFINAADSGSDGPIFIEVYGSYGKVLEPKPNKSYQWLIKNGINVAIPHVRGSGYYGKAWHTAGSGINKQKSLDDLLTCLKYFKHSSPNRKIALFGKSAGGLLAASAAVKDPKLVNLLVLDAPFLNPIENLSNTDSKLWHQETAEWGDPLIPENRELMQLYSPESAFTDGALPQSLIFARVDDKLVGIQDILAWVSKYREANTKELDFLMAISNAGGHGGPASASEARREQALMLAFVHENLR